MRMKAYEKIDFPVSDIRRFLEPGPIVLVSSAWQGKTNIMTMGWHMVMEFVPSLVGCYIWSENHSFEHDPQEPAVRDQYSDRGPRAQGGRHRQQLGARHRQVRRVRADAGKAAKVKAPLIAECYANFECKLVDSSLINKYSLFVWEVVKAHVATSPKYPRTIHYRGDGVFMVSGANTSRYRKLFKSQNL